MMEKILEKFNNKEKSESVSFRVVFILGVLSYICGICTLPECSVLTTFPLVFILSVVATYFIKNCKTMVQLGEFCVQPQ